MELFKEVRDLTGEATLRWMPTTTTRPRSRREIELAHASAKSHCMKLCHRRKKIEAQLVRLSNGLGSSPKTKTSTKPSRSKGSASSNQPTVNVVTGSFPDKASVTLSVRLCVNSSSEHKGQLIAVTHTATNRDMIHSESNKHGIDSVATKNAPTVATPQLGGMGLMSSLDPFVKLPIEINEREKGVLHFFLSEGRAMLPGTSKDTKHCVALRVAQNWMQSSPVYVISHVMMAETILQRLTGNELPLDFYKRRAQLYAAVRDIMSPASTAGLVVFAVIQLIWVEFVLKLPHLQVMHVNALNTLIDANGGLAKYLSKTKDGPVLEPRFYVGMHILTEAHIANDMLLKKMRDQFISNLGRIQRWFLCVQHFSQNLQSLTIFLTEPINIDLLDSPFHKAVSCFFCCYNTCMAFIEYECDTGRALEYLIQVQKT